MTHHSFGQQVVDCYATVLFRSALLTLHQIVCVKVQVNCFQKARRESIVDRVIIIIIITIIIIIIINIIIIIIIIIITVL